jgi:hypothetical protein
MTHATPEEIHDHAYGFRVSEHVDACADCGRRAGAVAAERELLKEVLREDPVSIPAELEFGIQQTRARRRYSAPALAAAVLLLGGLAWMLFQPKTPVEAPAPPSTTSTHEEDLEKIIEQLKSSSPLRQDLARMALKKYGGMAIPALERAKADPTLIEECRGFNLKDQDLYRKAQAMRLTVAWDNTELPDVIDQLRTAAGMNFHISNVADPSAVRVTLKLQNASVVEILDRLAAETKVPWGRTLGVTQTKSMLRRPTDYQPILLIGAETPPPPSSVPVRVRSIRGWAAEQLRLPPERRKEEEYHRLFLCLAQAADPSLWDYLDSPRAEVRRLAEESLRRLYGPPATVPLSGMEALLEKSVGDLSYESQPYGDILLDLGFHEGVALVLDPRVEIPVLLTTVKTTGLSLKNSLSLVLRQQSLAADTLGGALFVTKREWLPFQAGGWRPLWTTPDEALRAEAVIDDLASDDPSRQEKARSAANEAGRDGLTWLCHGRFGVDPARVPRFVDALHGQAAALGIVLALPMGGAYQQDLTAAQKAILSRPLSLRVRGRSLGEILKEKGIKHRLQEPVESPLLVSSPSLRVDDFLLTVTQPLGLDFYLDGDTIVVDTGQKVQKAVEKK